MRRHRVLSIGRWRLSFWRGPTRLGVHCVAPGAGSAGLGLFGLSWLHRNPSRTYVCDDPYEGESE